MLLYDLPVINSHIFYANRDCNAVHVDQFQLGWPNLLLVLRIQESILKVLVLPSPKVSLQHNLSAVFDAGRSCATYHPIIL